ARLKGQQPGAHVPDPMREELHRLLWEQMEKLDPDAHEVLVLHYFMKKKAREIAALLEIQPNAVEKRLQRAREELGRRLTELLGEEIEEVKADGRRGDRIMAAICASPVGWKVSAAASSAATTVAGVATGAGAAKVAATVAAALALALAGYLAVDRYTRTPPGQDARVETAFAAEVVAPAAPEASVLPEPAAPEIEEARDAKVLEPFYAPVYGTVKGTVSKEDGTPAAGVPVWLDNQYSMALYSNNEYVSSNAPQFERIRPLKLSTRTDSGGGYRIEGVPLVMLQRYWPEYEIKAEGRGTFASVLIQAKHMDREVVANLTLLPDMSLGGTVTDGEGKPVKEATVHLRSESDPHGEISRQTTSDAGGVFLFEHVPPGMCMLSVSAKGYLDDRGRWLAAGRLDHVLRLDKGSSVSGRVVDMAGRPVADVFVRGYGANTEEEASRYPEFSFSSETDSQGLFEVTGFKPEVYALAVDAKWGETLALTLVEPLTVTVGTEPVAGLLLKMAPGAVLRGTVIDEEGAPIPAGSRVWAGVSNNAGGHGRGCEIGADGSYEIVGLPPGELKTRVRVPYELTRFEGTVTLAAGEVKENHEIRLRSWQFSGLVIDEQGQPVPWASVYAVEPVRAHVELGETLADGHGRFQFDLRFPPASPEVYVQALSDGGYSAPAGPYRDGETARDMTLRIVRSGRLEGEVVTGEGLPFKTGYVSALPDTGTAVLLRTAPENDEAAERGLQNGGRFEYAKLHPGRYTLEVWQLALESDAPLTTTVVSVQTGRTTEARLVVDMAGYGGVEGVVLQDGKPVYGTLVVVESAGLKRAVWQSTGADGRYSVYGVPPGLAVVTLEPSIPSGRSAMHDKKNTDIVAGAFSTVDFEFFSGKAAVEGTVTENGVPSEDVAVTFEPQDVVGAASFTARPDEKGYYKVEGVPEGAYRVEAWTGRSRGVVQAQLAAGQTARINFELRTSAIHGRVEGVRAGEKAVVVVLPAEAELAEWTAESLEALGGQIVAQTEAGQYGVFNFDAVEEGDYCVCAVGLPAEAEFDVESVLGGRMVFSAPFHAAPSAPVEVELELK
ncbi:MAG: carboxypeptidase regulatory-like domain-containing protein, partial [Candidatus Hydrogenedentes bacterium]|nr:carboxypeptidase regulatory-like domain-containing protein [Candidatus Hydrogenedentota bacterium]